MDTDISQKGALGPPYADHLRRMDVRLATALEAAGLDGLVVFAGDLKTVFRDDLDYPFRVEPYFKAWVPLTRAPGSWLKLIPGARPVLIYLQEEDFWQAPPHDPEGYWAEHVEVRPVRTAAEARNALGNDLSRHAAIGEGVPKELGFGAINDRTILDHLDYFRAYKTPYEIACLERAAARAVAGHRAVERAFGTGASELELHQRYLEATSQRETELPYSSIVALNRHACVLHYQHLDAAPAQRVLSLLLDAGADFNGYASDITRTWTTDEGEFRDLIISMDALQQAICRMVLAGTDFVELNEETHRHLAAVLAQHGLVTCPAEQAYDMGITRTFLPHGLGHLLGLQVHDAGGHQTEPDGSRRPPPAEHPFLRLTRTLAPGFVLTIEPGLYFIPALLERLEGPRRAAVDWAVVERLAPFGGVRIEDDVVVTEGEPRNLSRDAFTRA
jgi:Xaa-Pro dipeptidase